MPPEPERHLRLGTFAAAVGHPSGVSVYESASFAGFPSPGAATVVLFLMKMPGRIVGQNLITFSDITIDNHVNVIGWSASGFFVYTGCSYGKCRFHGPFPFSPNTYDPQALVLNTKNARLFVTDFKGNGSYGDSVDVYAYHGPNGIKYLYSITAGLSGTQGTFGVAKLPSD